MSTSRPSAPFAIGKLEAASAGAAFTGRRRFGALAAASVFVWRTSASGAPVPKAPLVVNVMDFGACGDGHTDDSSSINAALDFVRTHRANEEFDFIGFVIEFPAATYVVGSTLNFTSIRKLNTLISGNGSVIVGRCANAPVIDAFNSRWLTMRDFTIIGDRNQIPTVGMQIGVINRRDVADDHFFENIKFVGSFTLAAFYNRGSETSSFNHMLFWNGSHTAHCLIQDGLNHFPVESTFVTVDLKQDEALSFNENLFVNCDFRNGTGLSPVWLGDTARHEFIRCYSASEAEQSFTIFSGSNGNKMLSIDCHCEASLLKSIFYFDGLRDYIIVSGFTYLDHEPFAQVAIFSCAGHVRHVTITGGNITIARYANEACRLFADPTGKWEFVGDYFSMTKLETDALAVIRGRVMIGSSIDNTIAR